MSTEMYAKVTRWGPVGEGIYVSQFAPIFLSSLLFVIVVSTVALALSGSKRIWFYTFIGSYLAVLLSIGSTLIGALGYYIGSAAQGGQSTSPVENAASAGAVGLVSWVVFTFIFCAIWSGILKSFPGVVREMQDIITRLKGQS